MWVKNYMCTWVNKISPDKTLKEAVKQMVKEKTNSAIVVDENDKPIGILSSHIIIKEVVPDYLKDDPTYSKYGAEGTFDKYAKEAKDKKVEDIMHKDFHELSINDPMIEAAAYASKGARRIIPVVDAEGKLVGAITRTCIKNALHNVIFKDDQVDPSDNRDGCFANKRDNSQ
jgi:predicted transcriptional regulator